LVTDRDIPLKRKKTGEETLFSPKELEYIDMIPQERKKRFSVPYLRKLRFQIRKKVRAMTSDLSLALYDLGPDELDQIFPPDQDIQENDLVSLYSGIQINIIDRWKKGVDHLKKKMRKEKRAMDKEVEKRSRRGVFYLMRPTWEYPCPKCRQRGTPYESEARKWFWIHDDLESNRKIGYCYIGKKPEGYDRIAMIGDKDKLYWKFQELLTPKVVRKP